MKGISFTYCKIFPKQALPEVSYTTGPISHAGPARLALLLTFCLKMSFQMFLENIEAAERTEESAELMTAAEMAPRPTKETKLGVRCWMTSGRIMAVWLLVMQVSTALHSRVVSFQSAGRRMAEVGEGREREIYKKGDRGHGGGREEKIYWSL